MKSAQLDRSTESVLFTLNERPASRGEIAEEIISAVPSHPWKIRSSGNSYVSDQDDKRSIGYFQILPDEFLLNLLEWLDTRSLRRLGSTCRALFAFCASDDLWKTLLIESQQDLDFRWQGTWRSTYLQFPSDQMPRPICENLFSDALYRPYLCAHTPLTPYSINIPRQNAIARLSNLTSDEFTTTWCDKPFILTAPVREWPVYRDWDIESLSKQYGDTRFRQESVDWRLSTYIDYMNNTTDESPLYLFDRSFVEKMSLRVGRNTANASYWIPDCFGEDLFEVLGPQRPDSRWLIIGPARSGSTYHKDPNATSAWNAVLRGSKYWIMFPSSSTLPPPPGVFVSEDQSEVTSPLSIAEWLLGFHAEARRTPGCIEAICAQGEVLHVPSGWWHLVVNLEPSIAITQNFVPRAHLVSVLSFLDRQRQSISGFAKDVADPYALFVECMRREHPDLLEDALEALREKENGRKRKWDVAVAQEVSGEGGFSFGFGGGEDSEDDIP